MKGVKTRSEKAKNFVLLCVVTDPSGEWTHGSLITEMTDMGYGHTTTANAIRKLKDDEMILAERVGKERAARLFPTIKGVTTYASANGWPDITD